ncbi:MAG TPA: amino acid ABC transporter substrate-binding protein [Actinomycetota bacterium]|nr:amino acid ABC transporter substrate-binding protein [Actinomycetota bacterium]
MRRRIWHVAVLALTLAVVAAACTREQPAPEGQGGGGGTEAGGAQQGVNLLAEIQERGTLRCGVNNTVPGFGFETAEGTIEGFDVDFCIAIAAALFGTDSPEEGTHYELVPIDADNRFTALRAGEYDVLVRNTTWTSSRDGTEGVQFTKVNFYDGQAMIAPAANVSSIEDLDGATICVTAGTTTELNLADYFREQGLDFEPLTLEDYDQIFQAFRQERCDAVTGDRSALASLAPTWSEDIGELTILEDVMSKEPLTPAVLEGDANWHDVVFWVTNGLILAEELGVTQDNVQQEAQNPSTPGIAALLGAPFAEDEEVNVAHGLELDDTFMQNAIAAVGNYGEIFDRNIGPDTEIGLERGLNALWTEDGLQYAIPFR